METNEQRKRILREAVQEELERFFEAVDEIAEGQLEQLEEQVVKTSQQLGRTLLEGVLNSRLRQQRPAARRQGSCGHRQRLVGERPKELLTLVGKVRFVRPYYQCLEVGEQEGTCTHGEAPDDVLWGVHQRRTTGGVQREISYLCGRLTFEEAADTFCRQVPLGMSGRQALNLMRPLGKALAVHQDQQVNALWAQASQPRTQASVSASQPRDLARLYIEVDGVLTRMRRGSVPLEKQERHRPGDVYREVKVGAVFRAERGRERSELVPGVLVDTPAPDSLHYVARRTAKKGFDRLLYSLAVKSGLERAQQVVVLGDGAPWIWNLVSEQFPQAVQIVDLYHAKEHVWDVAHAVFGGGTSEATAWATQACTLLVEGQIEALVAAIGALPPIAPEPGQTRSIPERAVDYFSLNAERMRYPIFRAEAHASGQRHRRGRLQNGGRYPHQTVWHAASLLRASMLSCLCARLFSITPTTHSGSTNMPPDYLQPIHTPARVIATAEEGDQLQTGEILVTTVTNVGWTPLFPRAAAVVTDVGTPLSHAAIVARELGIPVVVGCGNATMRLHTGEWVQVNGGQGTVEVLRAADAVT